MPKRKQLAQTNLIRSLEELISDDDRDVLVRALSAFQANDLGWQILKAALMKEYLATVAYSLDASSKSGTQIEAAYYSGAAQTMFDTANHLIPKYRQILEGTHNQVVEEVRPQE